MPTEEHTADGFPDKGEIIPPSKIRNKPDCDRKTLIPDPCDLRIDRRKKSEDNNDCVETPIVQVCPEDLGKFKIPELPVLPKVFIPKKVEPILLPPLEVVPAPNTFCNEAFTLSCPSEGWLDADWARENLSNLDVEITEDIYGGVEDLANLSVDPGLLPDDTSIYVPPNDTQQEFGPQIQVPECSFVASTQKEANKLARRQAIAATDCKFCNPEITVDCEMYQGLALPIGGADYTYANTYVEITGDGKDGEVGVQIDESTGQVTGLTVINSGADYKSIDIKIIGDGVGAAVGRVVLSDEDDCGGEILEVELGQVLPDPNYNPETDPEIYTSLSTVCVPKCTVTSDVSVEDAEDQALEDAYASLDCAYQSPELDKPCPPPKVPKTGFQLPLGAFKTRINRGTQAEVTNQAQEIIDALECVEICCPDGFPEAIIDINVYDPNEVCETGLPRGNIADFDATFDCESCEYRFTGHIELPEIPCKCGFETSTEVTGLEVTQDEEYILEEEEGGGGGGPDGGGDCSSGRINVGINVVGNVEANLDFDLDNCKFDLDIDLPNIELECTEIELEVDGLEFEAKTNKAPFSFELEQEGELCVESNGCEIAINLPNFDLELNIPCPDGYNTAITISGGIVTPDGSGPSGTLELDSDTCELNLDLELPNVDIPCPEGYSAVVNITGGVGPDEEQPTANFTIENDPTCALTLDIDLPDMPCPDGFDVEISGGCVQVTKPNTEPCKDEDVGANVSACLSDNRAEPENEAWNFNEALPNKNAPSGPNPPICVEEGETITLEIPAHPGGGNDRLIIADPSCTNDCDDRVDGGGNLTLVEAGDEYKNGNTKLSAAAGNNVKKLTTSGFTIGQGGTLTFTAPSVVTGDGEGRQSLYYYSSANPEGMVGELQVVESGTTCDISGGSIGCGDCSTGEEEGGGSSSPSADFDPESCALTISLPDVDIEMPDIPCPCGYEATANFNVTGGVFNDVEPEMNGSIELSLEECSLDLSVDLELPNIDIECANGYSTSSSVTITGGSFNGGTSPTANVGVGMDNCELSVDLELELPDIDVECANGYTTSSSIDVAQGENSTNGTADINLTIDNCALEISGSINFPDVELPEIACANGYSTSSSVTITGGSFNGGLAPTANVGVGVDNCELSVDLDLELPDIDVECANGYTTSSSIDVVQGENSSGGEANISLNLDNCELEISGSINFPDVELPELACANGYSTTSTVTLTGGSFNGEDPNLSAEINIDNCELDLTVDLELPDIEVECANGYTVGSTSFGTAQGSGYSGSCTADIAVNLDNCELDIDCNITLPDIDFPCPNGVSATGSIGFSGGAVTGSGDVDVSTSGNASNDVSISVNGCEVQLSGGITLPDYVVSHNVVCPDGLTATGSVDVSGGAITGSGDIEVEETGSLESNIAISVDNCEITLSGDITLPEYTISGDLSNVTPNCADVPGALCEDDYTTTTLSVCDSSGQTSSLTVLVPV